ncbi:MAG: hypothetical protein J2P26_05790 [Nocardiopsaceae bacterium]|nr:hypothetical protein [Nocardiopsaceae bacterium]
MDRTGLLTDLAGARIAPGEIVYLERRRAEYRWHRLPPDTVPGPPPGESLPDAWMFYSGRWPDNGSADVPAFVEDLVAEMESMADGSDRCRWPLDQPYPHMH